MTVQFWATFLWTAIALSVVTSQIQPGVHYITEEWNFENKSEVSGLYRSRVQEGYFFFGTPESNLLAPQKKPQSAEPISKSTGPKNFVQYERPSFYPLTVGGSRGFQMGNPPVAVGKRAAPKNIKKRSADEFSSWKIFNSLSPTRFFSSGNNLVKPADPKEEDTRKKRSTSAMNGFFANIGSVGPSLTMQGPLVFIDTRTFREILTNLHYYVQPVDLNVEFSTRRGAIDGTSRTYIVTRGVEESGSPVDKMDLSDYYDRLVAGDKKQIGQDLRRRRATEANLRLKRDGDFREPKITSWSTSGAGVEGRRRRRSFK